MHSCDLLIEALAKYEGSIILVSHDRYFVSKTANKIWEIVDHQIKEFKGGYEEWVAWKERMAKQEADLKKAQAAKEKEQAGNKKIQEEKKTTAAPVKQVNTSIDKEAKKELQKMQRQFQQLEEKIAALNSKKAALEASLSDPATYSDKVKFQQAETAYKNAASELNSLNAEYEKVFEKIMQLEQK
jgi:ATP-binding cassette subfamily F protein 3